MSLEKQTLSQKPHRFFLWLIGLVVLTGGVLAFYFWTNQRMVGAIIETRSPSEKSTQEPSAFLQYKGKYITFSYSEKYTPYSTSSDVKFPILEQVLFSTSDIEGRKISVVVQDNTGYLLDEYPGVHMRVLEKGLYQEEKLMQGGRDFILFTKASSVFEAGAFWQEEGRIFSIIISSPIRFQGLQSELLTLLDSLKI